MNQPLPLRGIRVVEFSHMVMGPSCGLIFADLGAEVIKVEPAPEGEKGRRLKGAGAGFFVGFNRNKKSLMLELNSEQGLESVRKLVKTADVFLENFRPEALKAKGLDYASLAKLNPRLVYCSLKGFLSGPYQDRTALDEVAQMMTGLAYMTGPPGRPLRAGAPVNDLMGGLFGALAVLAALRERDLTGKGEHVQSGLFENSAYLVSAHMLQHAVTGVAPPPMPAGKRAWGVYDVFESSDGVPIFIGVVTDRQWETFTQRLNAPMLQDPAYATNNDRAKLRETLIPLVASLLHQFTIAELEELCATAGLPFGRVNTPSDLVDDPHLNAGGMISLTLAHGDIAKVPALPIQFGSMRPGLRTPPPTAGEHNQEILGELERAPSNA